MQNVLRVVSIADKDEPNANFNIVILLKYDADATGTNNKQDPSVVACDFSKEKCELSITQNMCTDKLKFGFQTRYLPMVQFECQLIYLLIG